MLQSRRNGLIAAMVAGGGLAFAGVGALAHADADADGRTERSPGLLSGNLVQLPVHAPVNVCGNTVSVVGVLNPAAGNRCTNGTGDGGHPGPRPSDPSSPSSKPGGAGGGGAAAEGRGKDSPGLLSGNGLQLPVDLPVNLSGNSVNVVGVGNGSHGNTSVNGETPTGGKPTQPRPTPPPVSQQPVTPPAPQPRPHTSALANTGSDGVGYLLPGGGALLLGGALLYRRFRLN
ncbi:chaplin family protein [Streptomyces sp. RerS4]|uniref:chaplin n=1 Tax=Streptomyces sp. RerS4 TaxID=2942449 RepID=UPI00201C9427|nr:chaplin family protein [Streptomyces sp. RerS4]UQX00648.1 chaplin [Streptomyces sp. RerS4]